MITVRDDADSAIEDCLLTGIGCYIIHAESRELGAAMARCLKEEPDGTLTYVAPSYLADLKPEMGDG